MRQLIELQGKQVAVAVALSRRAERSFSPASPPSRRRAILKIP